MKRCKLIKISSSHNNLRTDSFSGFTNTFPTIGQHFRIFNDEPIDKLYGYRMIETTPVMSIKQIDNGFLFNTRNSRYKLIII